MNVKKPLVAALLSLGLLSSCLGPNRLINQLYEWNMTATDDKWQNEGIFAVFNIIPLYPLAWIGDIVVFNSIEWWGGASVFDKQPAKTDTTKSTTKTTTKKK